MPFVKTTVAFGDKKVSLDPEKLINSIVDVICLVDQQGTILYISQNALSLFGYRPDELIGSSFHQFVVQKDIDKTLQLMATATTINQISNFEIGCLRKDGEVVHVIWSGRWDENDGIFYCVARDGSDKRNMELRLLKAQQMASVANFEYDVNKQVFTHVSANFFEICGLTKEKAKDLTLNDFLHAVHPEDRYKVQALLHGPDTTNSEYRILHANGSSTFVSHQQESIYNEAGCHIRTIGVLQDITERKLTELNILHSERRFKSLVQNGNDMIGIVDAAGVYVFVGDTVTTHLGYAAGELVGRSAFDFIHPDDIPMTSAYLEKALTSEFVAAPPYRFRNAAGKWRWMDTRVVNHISNPAINGFVVNSRDITEKKHQEDEYRMLSQVVQESPNAILVTDLQQIITWTNKAFLQLSELSLDAVVGKSPSALFPGEDLLVPGNKSINDSRQSCKVVRYISQSGKQYWLELQFQSVFDTLGLLKHYLIIGRDITVQKTAELARLQSEKRFQALVQHGSDLIVIIDDNANFRYASDNIQCILGYHPAEIIGQNAYDFIHPDDHRKVEKELFQLLNEKAVNASVQHRFKTKQGQWVWLESKGTNHAANHSIQGILVNSRNINDRVELQRRLNYELINKQKEITAAVIRAQETERSQLGLELHDNVNQVLTTVKLYNEMYLTGMVEDKEILSKSSDYIQDCINEIRSISKRLSAPTLGSISLQDSIQELVDSINLTNRVRIICHFNGLDQFIVSEDLHLGIYRIVQEGLNNVLKYANATTVIIELNKKENDLCLHINDDGQGFDTTIKRKGIGITNMKTRAENLNGSFFLESAPGQGCLLRICFHDIS